MFQRQETLPECSGSCEHPIGVQTLAEDAPRLSPGIVSSQMLFVVIHPLLEITTVKCFKWWVCCPVSGCSDRGDSYVSREGRTLALHPESALWSSEENEVWLMHPQCKKIDGVCSLFLYLWLSNVDWSRCSELSRFSPCKQWKIIGFIYKEFLESLLHTHINNYLLGWFWFNRVLKSIWRKFLL